jgi:hypothetical protein
MRRQEAKQPNPGNILAQKQQTIFIDKKKTSPKM